MSEHMHSDACCAAAAGEEHGEFTRDPVCGMRVDIAADPSSHVHGGRAFHFCNPNCRLKFIADPASYITAVDPVCGMQVDRAAARHMSKHDGGRVFFCSASCQAKFDREPQRYGDAIPAFQQHAAAGTLWICPMDPEVEEDKPGDCPICGMPLEPAMPRLDDGPNPEIGDFSRRAWIGAALTLPLLIIAMGPHVGVSLPQFLTGVSGQWLQLALATPVTLWCGLPFFRRAWASIATSNYNMWTLIGLGTGAAFAYSVLAVVAGGIFPSELRQADGTLGVYFESAAVIIVLVLVGQILEGRARERTGAAIKALLELAPETAHRIRSDGGEEEVDLEQVRSGDHLRVRANERVPVDGIVVEGASAIDESMLTGEPMPVAKTSGDSATGGTMNGTGSFIMRAERVGAETVLSQIVSMVAAAQRSRAPVQALADRFAGWFVPAVVAVAVVAFVLWLLLGPEPQLAYALVALVSVLIIACPCALGLATPMSIMVAVGRGATGGILVKNAEALERFAEADVLVVDKTGTLTAGKPEVSDIVVAPGSRLSADSLLSAVAGLEQSSEHPLAGAIIRECRKRNLKLKPVKDFQSVTGKGVVGTIAGKRIVFGNAGLMAQQSVDFAGAQGTADELRADGKTVMFVGINERWAGLIAVSDPVKPGAADALRALQDAGLKIVMATGDERRTAEAVAARLSIDEVHAGILPAEKAALIDRFKSQGATVVMAGDGVNDAPALATADVGIAMADGSNVAVESAGLTLLKGDLASLVRARNLAVATMRNIRQNLFFAFVYNTVGVPVAAGVLYPVFGLLLSPMIASAAMSLSSVSVITNALRLRRISI